MKSPGVYYTLFILLLSLSLNGISSTLSSVRDSIELNGMVFNNKNRVQGVVINVYNNNTLLKKVKVKSTNRFKTYLPVNAMLTIEITAPGYHSKRFMIDTKLPRDLKKMPKYEFDIDIFREEELRNVNTSILDFPVGLVEYDRKKKEFVRNKKYTKRMKKAYLKLWEESQMAERSGLKKDN